MKNSLLPCPFCGPQNSQNAFDYPQIMSKTEEVVNNEVFIPIWESSLPSKNVNLYWVQCGLCESRGPLYAKINLAKEAWNERK